MSSVVDGARRTAPMVSWAIDARDFEAWMKGAAAGAVLDYAGGPQVPRGFPVVAAVRDAVARGLVLAHHRRDGGGWIYSAVRCQMELAPHVVWPVAGSAAARMLALLDRTAEAGDPCPTNAVLAISLSLRGAEQARYVLGLLVDAGLIAVENRGPRERRIVTMRASGKRTRSGPLASGGKGGRHG